MALSNRTLAEMRAGAEQIAANAGREFDGDMEKLLANLTNVAERSDAIKRWEREGLLTIETRLSWDHRAEDTNAGRTKAILHHITNGPTLEESAEALAFGGYPSELLVAQIALAIASCRGKETGDG